MAKRMKSAVAATVATLDPTLPAGAVPLRWGPPWPSVDARLYISGISGVWAYAGTVEYGRNRYIEIVPWAARNETRGTLWRSQEFARLTRYVAPIERVFVLAGGEA
jgi:hypothetical protein